MPIAIAVSAVRFSLVAAEWLYVGWAGERLTWLTGLASLPTCGGVADVITSTFPPGCRAYYDKIE